MIEIEGLMSQADFWTSGKSKQLLAELKVLKAQIGPVLSCQKAVETIVEFSEIADETMIEQLLRDGEQVNQELVVIEDELAFSGPDDNRNAFLTIQPGGGGVEAQDWAQMMMRMYVKWCDMRGFDTELVDLVEKDIGIASAIIKIVGYRAYGLLKYEHGCHKMARFSPFGKGKGQIRQTSFAAVEVEPEVDEVGEIEIPDSDIERGVCRGSGPGGQGINRTDSVVMLKHIPTGLRVRCQNTRSQHENGIIAMELLKAKLKRLLEQKNESSVKSQVVAGFGSEYVRVYNLEPKPRIVDSRTGFSTTDALSVLNGGLDGMIGAC